MRSGAAYSSPFSPAGRRWPEGSDEGAAATGAALRLRSVRSRPSPLAPLICPSDIFSPLGRRGKSH
ncbi:hypothetical protein EHI44_19090 [Rhizobium leguminosarum]|nr:hypothetical protein EHI44_19090 [Rhizobium leguminosarum]